MNDDWEKRHRAAVREAERTRQPGKTFTVAWLREGDLVMHKRSRRRGVCTYSIPDDRVAGARTVTFEDGSSETWSDDEKVQFVFYGTTDAAELNAAIAKAAGAVITAALPPVTVTDATADAVDENHALRAIQL